MTDAVYGRCARVQFLLFVRDINRPTLLVGQDGNGMARI